MNVQLQKELYRITPTMLEQLHTQELKGRLLFPLSVLPVTWGYAGRITGLPAPGLLQHLLHGPQQTCAANSAFGNTLPLKGMSLKYEADVLGCKIISPSEAIGKSNQSQDKKQTYAPGNPSSSQPCAPHRGSAGIDPDRSLCCLAEPVISS